MIFGRIVGSNRGVMYENESVLDIRPAGKGAETNGKLEGRAVADFIFINPCSRSWHGDDGVRHDWHEGRETA